MGRPPFTAGVGPFAPDDDRTDDAPPHTVVDA